MTNDTPTPKRVSNRLRFEVFRRDGFRCRYCGLTADDSAKGLTIDHVVPVALGGQNEPTNLVTACRDCNAGKTSTGPDEAHVAQVADDAVRWAAAMRQVADERQKEMGAHETLVRAIGKEWRSQVGTTLPPGWRDAIRRFAAEGLTKADMIRFIDRVAGMNRIYGEDGHWRYFCGCSHNEITNRQRKAQYLVAEPERGEGEVRPVEQAWYSVGDFLHEFGVSGRDADGLANWMVEYIGDEMADAIRHGYLDRPHQWKLRHDHRISTYEEVEGLSESFVAVGNLDLLDPHNWQVPAA